MQSVTSLASDKITYTNTSISSATNVKSTLDAIISKLYYTSPSISSFTMTPSTTTYEVGSSISSISFAWTLNKDVTSQTLTGCTITKDSRSATYSTAITSSKTFTLSVSDGTETKSSSKTINFYNKKHWGASSVPDRKSVV